MKLLVSDRTGYGFTKKNSRAFCVWSDSLQELCDVVCSMSVHVLLEYFSVYLHIYTDCIIPLGQDSVSPLTTAIRDITFNVNLTIALNQLVELF